MQRASRTLAVAIWPLLGEIRSFWRRAPRKRKWCWCSHLDLCAMTTPRSSIGSFAAFAGLRRTRGPRRGGTSGRSASCVQTVGCERAFFKPGGPLIVSSSISACEAIGQMHRVMCLRMRKGLHCRDFTTRQAQQPSKTDRRPRRIGEVSKCRFRSSVQPQIRSSPALWLRLRGLALFGL